MRAQAYRVCPRPMPTIAAAMLLGMLAAFPAFAQQAATVSALAATEHVEAAPSWAQRLSITAREALPGLAPPGSVDLGLRWRPAISGRQIDITAWRRMTPQPDAIALVQQQTETVYGARLEMRLAPASKTMFAHRFIGVQLDSGARIGIRKSNGNPTIYYRNQF